VPAYDQRVFIGRPGPQRITPVDAGVPWQCNGREVTIRMKGVRIVLTHVRDIAVGRPTTTGVAPIVIQLLLILLWHVALLIAMLEPPTHELLSAVELHASHFWHAVGLSPSFTTSVTHAETSLDSESTLGVLTRVVQLLFAAVALEGAFAAGIFLVLGPRARARPSAFVRSWWRACAWATLFILGAAVVISVFEPFHPPYWVYGLVINVCACAYMLFAPTFLARREGRPRRRVTSWRPVCPECGYSLRGLRADRCPECGVAFPTKSRVFRRWAIQRLIWDRTARGSLVFAYVRTLLAVTFCPCRAGRRLGMPDRYGRACRWAVGHVALLACVGLAFGQDSYFLDWTLRQLGPDAAAWRSMAFRWGTPSVGRMVIWAGQTFAAWLITLAVLPLLGALLGMAMAWHHPAARRGIVKWSLYATAIQIPVGAVWFALLLIASRTRYPSVPVRFAAQMVDPSLPNLFALFGVAYGLWWAMGVSSNPYTRHRGFKSFIGHAIVFGLAWTVLARVVFPAGPLKELL